MSYDPETIQLKDIIKTFKHKVRRLKGLTKYMPGLLHGTVEMMDAHIYKYENDKIFDIDSINLYMKENYDKN